MSYSISASILILLTNFVLSLTEERLNYEELYRAGSDAYLSNDWDDCVKYFESALKEYSAYQRELIKCRSGCEVVVASLPHEVDSDPRGITDFFGVIVEIALCNFKCEKEVNERLNPPPTPNEKVKKDLDAKIPYDYLQLCYFKAGDAQMAASSAYTYLVHHPEHEIMQHNLKYYMNLPSVNLNNVTYLEDSPFQKAYMKATKMYADESYQEVIEAMEKAVMFYLVAEDDCRHLCEGPWIPAVTISFYVSVANHFAHTLRCKLSCPDQIYLPDAEKGHNLFASHYHYLQYAYYKVGDLQNTCRAVASFLLLQPNDTVVMENRKFFLSMDDVREDWFEPRQETLLYHKRYQREKRIFNFIETSFGEMQDNVDNSSTDSQFSTPPVMAEVNLTRQQQYPNITLVLSEEQLNGTLRFMADGFMDSSTCLRLIHLASDGATNGDGYNGRLSPHTHFETFEGLTVGRAMTLTQRGLLDPTEVQLLLNISEKARDYVETYFNLKSHLYFAYTHLVCRTALNDSSNSRIDFSHPIHADNCVLTKGGDCLKQRPAYVWRDYSAILYLNDDFEGGEFIFAKNKDTIQATVQPKCGRLVAFSAGKENLHGVQAVLKGRRCAVAMWYTLDSKHEERERTSNVKIIADLVRNKKLMDEEVPTLKPNSREKTLKCSNGTQRKLQPPSKSKSEQPECAKEEGESPLHRHNDL